MFGPPSAGTIGGPWEEGGVPANPPSDRPLVTHRRGRAVRCDVQWQTVRRDRQHRRPADRFVWLTAAVKVSRAVGTVWAAAGAPSVAPAPGGMPRPCVGGGAPRPPRPVVRRAPSEPLLDGVGAAEERPRAVRGVG